ncbi:DUF6380 family protein [Streptomyces ziwulingensis]
MGDALPGDGTREEQRATPRRRTASQTATVGRTPLARHTGRRGKDAR